MHTASVHPQRSVIRSSIKVTLFLLAASGLMIFTFTHISSAQWLLLGMLIVAVMAIANRFSLSSQHHSLNINSNSIIYSDGGTIRRNEAKPASNSRPVVHDGGSYERANKS